MTEYVDELLVKTGFEADEIKSIKWRRFYYAAIPMMASVSVFFIGATLARLV